MLKDIKIIEYKYYNNNIRVREKIFNNSNYFIFQDDGFLYYVYVGYDVKLL